MAEAGQDGTWLLMDAAGPESTIGLVGNGKWLARETHAGDFLEWHDRAIKALLQQCGLELADLAGVIYASGPGSSLGLRLAAMVIRTLLQVPSLAHWQCLQYQNLELALAAAGEDPAEELVAPWRRDCLHRSRLESRNPLRFVNDALHLDAATTAPPHGVLLGRRPANQIRGIAWRPYPAAGIPLTLAAFPELLTAVEVPLPYSGEEPQFAKWSPRRHGAE